MRRRELLAGIGAATLPALAGCGCEAWTTVDLNVEPSALTRTSDGWRVDATLDVEFNFGIEGDGVFGAALAAFDEDGSVVGESELGDLRWADVPETDRTETECGSHGTLSRSGTVDADRFPQWVGLRFDNIVEDNEGERTITRYRGNPGAGASADGYEPVAVRDIVPDQESYEPGPAVESLTFRPDELTCNPATAPEIESSTSSDTDLSVRFARTVPEPHFRATLTEFSYGEVVQFDIGVVPRPQLHRTDCTAVEYEISTGYDGPELEPRAVELRHLDRDGAVVETRREPLGGTPTE